MKKRSFLFLFFLGGILLLVLVNTVIPRKNLYYVSKLDMYIKTIYYPKDEFGYILFGKDKDLAISDTCDYIAVGKRTGGVCASILVNSDKRDELNVLLTFNSIYKKNQSHYKFVILKDNIVEDTVFYEKRHLSDPQILKRPYVNIQVNEFFESVFISNDKDSYLHKLEAIK
jgi:hypothetical protein